MLSLNLELLSSLIGLARSVIGNEDLVTNHTNKLIYESLYNLSIDNKDISFIIKESSCVPASSKTTESKSFVPVVEPFTLPT